MENRFSVLFVLMINIVSAIHIISPFEQEVDTGDVIDLGTLGPGQTISLLISPKVTTGGLYGKGGYYDKAIVSSVPEGWKGRDSKLYGNLQVTITADPHAPEGVYYSEITVIDEFYGEKLDNITFSVKVRVSHNVTDIEIGPPYIRTGCGQPARFKITIKNKASTGHAFKIETRGSKQWEFTRSIFVPAMSSKTIYYEIVGGEEERYKTRIIVESLASPLIRAEKEVIVDVHSDVFSDLKATNNGVLLFPLFEGIVYSFLGIISNLF